MMFASQTTKQTFSLCRHQLASQATTGKRKPPTSLPGMAAINRRAISKATEECLCLSSRVAFGRDLTRVLFIAKK